MPSAKLAPSQRDSDRLCVDWAAGKIAYTSRTLKIVPSYAVALLQQMAVESFSAAYQP
jgi:hypothetical protein